MNTPQLITEDHPSFRRIAIATLVVTVLVAIIVLAVGYEASTAADNSGQVAIGNELASCRSQARSAIDDANKDISILVLRGLRASATGDRKSLNEVAEASVGAEHALDVATARYMVAVSRSISDPDGFLADCRKDRR